MGNHSQMVERTLRDTNMFQQNVFNIAVLNIIWAMVSDKRYDYDDPLIKELMMMVTDVTSALAPTPSLGFLGRHHHFPQN